MWHHPISTRIGIQHLKGSLQPDISNRCTDVDRKGAGRTNIRLAESIPDTAEKIH
jgi:hypothetical protein